eukprot:jgi/Chlat1/687/Chrsp104S01283
MAPAPPPRELRAGSILRLEVENFKSYKGRQVIGPFRDFTAVIGPNGAGKSNLMDAISFVLGVRSMQLRGAQLKDLVYSADLNDEDRERRRASVMLAYLLEQGRELHFMRSISAAGASEYKIDNKVVSYEAYSEQMRSLGLLVKARNFLVFQGDVESIASKSPKELTALLETISGSEELRSDYEEYEAKKLKAEERTVFSFQKKRGMTAEKKQKKEQKEEAERHLALQDELVYAAQVDSSMPHETTYRTVIVLIASAPLPQKAKKTEHYLWQLYCLDKDRERTAADLERESSELSAMTSAQDAIEAEVREHKKLQAKHTKDTLLVEKQAAATKAELEKNKPRGVKTKEEVQHISKRIGVETGKLSKARAEHDAQQGEIRKLQQDLEDVNAALDLFNQQQSEQQAGRVQLGEEQLNEYNSKRQEVQGKTFKLQQEKLKAERQQQSDQERLSSLQSKLQQMDSRLQQLDSESTSLSASRERCGKALQESRQKLPELKQKMTDLALQSQQSRARQDHIMAQLDAIELQLRELKADQRENDRENRAVEAIDSMKRLYPGVHGRLIDLCKPQHRRYNLAVAVVMGKNIDAVVVDDVKTGRECIQYLKDQRTGVMTFIPLHGVETKPVQERMRNLGGSAKLILDALLYACGNTLVCDTLDEAKSLAYGDDERFKVVSLDGTLISKSGSLTGGSSGNIEANARRFDSQAVEALKKNKARYTKEVEQLRGERSIHVQEQEFATEITGLEKKVQYAEADLKITTEKLAKKAEEKKALELERSRLQPEVQQLQESLARSQSAITKLQNKMAEVEDRIYSDWCAKIGVANIREYEASYAVKHRKAAEQRLDFQRQITKLQSQLEYEQQRDTQSAIDQLETRISQLQNDLKRTKKEEAKAQEALQVVLDEIEALDQQAQGSKDEADQVEAKIADLTKTARSHTLKSGKLKKSMATKEHHLEQLQTKRLELLESCEMEQIKLPALDTGDSMDVDTSDPNVQALRLDYSRLDLEFQQEPSTAEYEKVDAEFKASIDALQAEADQTAPNLKALDQYGAIKEKEKASIEEFEAAKKEAKEAVDAFNAVRNERYRRFKDAFEHVSNRIDKIYKDLTRSSTHPMGGTAYLTLENSDEPFLHGIKFTAMPPTKRFRDMEQLSGGEKTVAALALLFAIHSFRPAPFFVLDEVDAALDNQNVAKVANYIRTKSHSNDDGAGFQSVVISLKDNFYDKADALVGVYRDCDQNCSKTLTFDLGRYR